MSKTILEVKNLGKTYQAENGEIEALKNISFKEKEGELFSFIIFNVMVDFIYIITSI